MTYKKLKLNQNLPVLHKYMFINNKIDDLEYLIKTTNQTFDVIAFKSKFGYH